MSDEQLTEAASESTPTGRSLSKKLLPYVLLALLTIGLSFAIVRRHEMTNISPCVINFACDEALDRQRGDYRKVQYGFPLTYRATESFTRKPNGETTYGAVVREFQPFNPVFAGLNLLFWGSLLFYIWHLISRIRSKKATKLGSQAEN